MESETSHLGPKIWDLIPDELKSLDSVTPFKAAIEEWKPSNCPCCLCYDKNIYFMLAFVIALCYGGAKPCF